MAFDITPATWQLWCLATLALLMVMVVDSDVRESRIPNVLVLLMLFAGLMLNVFGPANGREGLLSHFPGALGAGRALFGALLGFAFLLPFYMLHAMGAGDVKLMAALGIFVGPVDVIGLVLFVLMAGGVLAVVRMVLRGNSRWVLGNVKLMLTGLAGGAKRFDPTTQSADRMPYALAFAAGLGAYAYWRLNGGAPLMAFSF
jgi:prepilin peptidase CpaA